MNDTHDNTCLNADLTTQKCLDDIFFRCTQAKGLAKLLSSVDNHELRIRGVHDLATVLVELMEDSIENLSSLQRLTK